MSPSAPARKSQLPKRPRNRALEPNTKLCVSESGKGFLTDFSKETASLEVGVDDVFIVTSQLHIIHTMREI